MTDGNGVAGFDLTAAAVGDYTVTITVRELVPALDSAGAQICQFTLSVAVR
jgi:hypothetical protein